MQMVTSCPVEHLVSCGRHESIQDYVVKQVKAKPGVAMGCCENGA